MKFSRAAAFSLFFGIGAALPDIECSPATTTIYQPTTITVKEPSIVTSTITLREPEGYEEGSSTTIYQTVTNEAPAQTITVNNWETTIGGIATTSKSSLKSFMTSTPNIRGTKSRLGIEVTPLPSADAPGAITQVNVISGISTLQVCPTGASTYDCTEVVYGSGGEVIVVNIITVDVTIDVYGEASTVTITKIASATSTPSLPHTGTGSLLGTEIGEPSHTGKPPGAAYSYGNGSHPIYLSGTIETESKVSHKPTGIGKPSKPTHVISVGQNGTLSFSPQYIDAREGETVRFKFHPVNHTVTSCDVTAPCVMNGVYDSGFKPILAKNMTTFVDFPVTDATKPLYFFSRQKNECEEGMVFAINPKSETQYDEFVSAAKNKKTNTTSHAPTGTANSTGVSRATGTPYSRNGTYSYGHPSSSSRHTSTHSELGIGVTGSTKAPHPTGGSNTTRHIKTATGFAHPSGSFKPSGSIRGSGFPHSSGSFRPTGIHSGTGHISSSVTRVSPTSSVNGTAVSTSSFSTTSTSSSSSHSVASSHTSSSHSTTSSSSFTVTTTSSITGYVPYSFPTPVASYIAQTYRA